MQLRRPALRKRFQIGLGLGFVLACLLGSRAIVSADRPALLIKEVSGNGNELKVRANIVRGEGQIEWVSVSAQKRTSRREGWVVPLIQAVHAKQIDRPFDTHLGLSFYDHEYRVGSLLDGVWHYREVSPSDLQNFDQCVFFHSDWSGGEVVFAACYRHADRRVTSWLKQKLRSLPLLGRLARGLADRVDRGKLIHSEPVFILATPATEVFEFSEEMRRWYDALHGSLSG